MTDVVAGLALPRTTQSCFQIHNRRYIGSKQKLTEWIFSIINKHCQGNSFADLFAGTGIVSAYARKHFDSVIVNDFLYSNQAIYSAFLGNGKWNEKKIKTIMGMYNNLSAKDLQDNYFSINFGQKFFSTSQAKIIGYIRENIEQNINNLTHREYSILLTSLLYATDKIANTVGHYEAYLKKNKRTDKFFMRPIQPIKFKQISIFREDANSLARQIKTDIVYIDPPYNHRQYSRYYHILETLTKWDRPELTGAALKPPLENMSDYCKVNAKNKFTELVNDIDAKYIVVSYNDTDEAKTIHSKNKMTLKQINNILTKVGTTQVFKKDHQSFNTGKTFFGGHKEYLFVTQR